MNDQPKLPALQTGGAVMAVVPHSFEEMWRVGKAVVTSGLAPKALVGDAVGDNAISAVVVAIMSGAEIGMPPMVSLRSFTVINGKPALYGDGLIGVIRRSGRAEYLRTGCEMRGKELVGWCEAKRRDTGEEKRVEFSEADARRAGLWSDQAIVKKFGKNGAYEKPNDSPWFRYPQRMLQWRAAGYCLRDLFADVLGGIATEDEVREVEFSETVSTRPSPPPPPPDETVVEESEQEAVEEVFAPGAATVTDYVAEKAAQRADVPPPPPEDDTEETVEAIFARADKWGVNIAKGDTDALETYLDEFGQLLDGLIPPDREHLQSIIDRHRQRVEPATTMAG